MLFESKEHHQFYLKCMEQSTKNDTYHRALFYTLGINPDTRRNIYEIYDFKTNLIHLNVLRKGWQTSGSYQVCLLAFNLFNGYTPKTQSSRSTPYELFDSMEAPYFMQAIKIKFPERFHEKQKGMER